ncbi:hypothetical protein SDC9_186977 [bioreactor metagenome]|uniref:Uncharacterized protein n=1 Tax=bioreactor metagenome TaxID=1076179 RepID=A0A645HMH1_9ZZZZ
MEHDGLVVFHLCTGDLAKIAVGEANFVLNAIGGGKRKVLCGDRGAVVPKQVFQHDGPLGAVVVRCGGFDQIIILLAAGVHGDHIGYDQVHNNAGIDVVLYPDVRADRRCRKARR